MEYQPLYKDTTYTSDDFFDKSDNSDMLNNTDPFDAEEYISNPPFSYIGDLV